MEGFKQAEAPSGQFDDEDAEWIDRPRPGESVQGIILDMTPDCGEYGNTVLKFRRTDEHDQDSGPIVVMWSTNQIDNLLAEPDLGAGDEVIIECTGREEFDRDGESVEFHNYEVYYRA